MVSPSGMNRALKMACGSKVFIEKLGAAGGAVFSARPAITPAAATAIVKAAATSGDKDRRAGRASAAVVLAPAGLEPDRASIANARSRADWKRSFGFFSRHRRIIRLSAGEASSRGPDSSGGSCVRIAVIVSAAVSRSNARLPLTSSYRTAPSAKTSARASTGWPRTCSGAM